MRPTIYDIARQLGTTHATVSRALRDDPSISLATRERVKRAARQMNYQPNLLARGLIRGSTKTVGLLLNGFSFEVTMAKVLALDRLAQAAGYRLFVTNTQANTRQTLEAAREFVARGADGLLVYGLEPHTPVADSRDLLALRVPIVFFDQPLPIRCRQVVLDRSAGVMEAVDSLVALGHREIFMFRSDHPSWEREGRFVGFLRACRRHRLSRVGRRIIRASTEILSHSRSRTLFEFEEIARAVDDLLRQQPKATAIICSNDTMALAVISALRKQGRRVPQDVSVVGFDDIIAGSYTSPRLATVSQPIQEVAQSAWQLLFEAIEQPGGNTKVLQEVRTHFIRRESVGPAPS